MVCKGLTVDGWTHGLLYKVKPPSVFTVAGAHFRGIHGKYLVSALPGLYLGPPHATDDPTHDEPRVCIHAITTWTGLLLYEQKRSG